jgi:DNA-binding response OmpR family regulator
VLHREGYKILEAAQGHAALTLARQHSGPIDLLVTDVVMPQMSGRELAEQLSLSRQHLKVLFISGYTDDAVVRHGLPSARIDFLGKPFSAQKLVGRVREVIDRPDDSRPQLARAYYEDAHSSLIQTLDTANSAVNTRSFAQATLAQGNVLGMIGDLAAAGELFARGKAIFQALGDRSGQALALERLGWMARERGDAAVAMAFLDESVALSRKLGDQQQIAWALLTISGVAILREDAAGAEALIAQGATLNPESHDWFGWSLNHRGHAAQLRREYDRAEHLHQRTLEVFVEQLGDTSTGVMWAYQGLGEAALGKGDGSMAQRWLREDLRLSRGLGSRFMIAWCLAGLGGAAALGDAPRQAARLWGASDQLRARLGCRVGPASRLTYERLLAQARAQIGVDAFAEAWAEGGALSLDQAIAEALSDEG